MTKFSFLFPLLFITIALKAQDDQDVNTLLQDAEYQKAIKLIDNKLLSSSEDETIVLLKNKKVEAFIGLGNFSEATEVLHDISKKLSSKFLTGVTQTNYGLLYLNEGRYDLANNILKEALNHFEEAGKSESLEATQALSHLGNLYRATGKYAQAEEQLSVALNYRQKLLSENSELIAASYNDLGLVFSSTDPEKSLDYYEKALVIYKNLHEDNHPKIAIANTNIGFIYRQLGLYGDAVLNFETALDIWKTVYPNAHPSKAFILFNLGETYQKIDDQKTAAEYYDQARKMYTECYGKKHPELARVLNALGNLQFSTSDYDAALNYYQTALQANASDFNDADVMSNPPLENFYDGNVLLYSMLHKVKTLEARHFGKTLKFNDLIFAVKTLQRCDSLIDRLRKVITNESDKINLGTIANEVYGDGVRISMEASRVAFSPGKYRAQAFYFAEKSKSAVLLDAIADTQAKSFAGIPDDLLEEEINLKAAITLCAQKLAQKPTPEEELSLRETAYSLNRKYESFIQNLEANFPQYFNLKFNTAIPSVDRIQNKLGQHELLLSYFIDDANKRLYIFQITHNNFKITDHALPENFDRLITGMRNSLFYNDQKTYVEASGKLSTLLLPRHIPSNKSELIILPAGRMSVIPFEALFSSEAKDVNVLPYLIRKHNVRYEFSAGLILQRSSENKNISSPSILLCAPVSFPEKDNLNDLPGTALEVEDIAQLFADKKLKSSLFLRKEADETLVKSPSIKDYNYLHFATHGIVDETNPDLSRIFLQSDNKEDGSLFASEIYNLQLNANLVTLSACQTGLGKIAKGEGVIGLSRALVYAGAQNIMVSFWSVSDASTALLMKTFYEKMLNFPQAGLSENLRQAKLSMINNKTYDAPFYWAPFILIGSQ